MARRKLEDSNIRKLTKVGGNKSISMTLPIGLIRKLGWRKNQKVTVKKSGEKLIIKDWEK